MTEQETQRAEMWSKLTKPQRIAWLRSTATLHTTSTERQTAVAQLKRKATRS